MYSHSLPDKIHGQYQKQEPNEVIPLQRFIFEKNQGEYGKNKEGNHFLNHFELYQCKRTAVFLVTHTVGRHHKTIFQKSNQPTGQHNAEKARFLKKTQVLKFQVTIPGESHKNIGQQQQGDGRDTAHKIVGIKVRLCKCIRQEAVGTNVDQYLILRTKINSDQTMYHMKLPVFALLFSLLVLNACQNRQSSSNIPAHPEHTKVVTDNQLPAGFLSFYDKFHQDSLFQIAHIQWPLRGEKSVQIDSVLREQQLASWEPETWNLQYPVDFSTGEFKREWEILGDELVIERIKYAAANYGLERRFVRRDDGEWELIYYADMQEMGH